MIKATSIVFDLDGTLLDTALDFSRILNLLLAEHNKPPLPHAKIRSAVSNGAEALIHLGFNIKTHDSEYKLLRQRFLTLYENNLAIKTKFFPGISQLLATLNKHKIPWGIVTNKPKQYTIPLLTQMSIIPPYGAIICPEDVTTAKPDPEPMLTICKILNCHPKHTLCIGDHQRDIASGNAAGMTTVAALYGYIEPQDQPKSWQADHYITHASEINKFIQLNLNCQ